jgi:exopolysaccharide production protein ExoQ
MTAAATRLQHNLGLGDRTARIVAWGALAVVAMSVAVSARFNVQLQLVGLMGALVVFLASLRWPLLPLVAFAGLIPIEEAFVLGQLGTISRYAEILFIVAYGLPRIGRLTISAMPVAGWAYVGWAMFSVAWAIDANVTWQELPILGLLFTMAILVAAFVVERPTIVRPTLWVYSLSASITAVIGITEYLRGDVTADRVAALPGQDPAHFAALLLPALVFVVHELLAGRWILIASTVAMACTAGIVISGTRGAWLAAAVVAALYLLPRLDPIRRLVALGVVAILLGLTLQLPGVSALISERTDSAVASGGAGRTDIWSVGLRIYASTPVIGVGLDNFPIAYTPERIRASDVDTIAPWRPAFRAPHDIIIGTLGELGTIGLILLAWFLGPLLIRRGWGADAATVQAMLASLCTMALFLDLLNRKQMWLVLGLACGLAFLARRERLANAAALPDDASPLDGAPSRGDASPRPLSSTPSSR